MRGSIQKGEKVWLPCKVGLGSVSNERLVRVESGESEWVVLVPIVSLREPVETGSTLIEAIITKVNQDSFTVNLPGHPMTSVVSFEVPASFLQTDGLPAAFNNTP